MSEFAPMNARANAGTSTRPWPNTAVDGMRNKLAGDDGPLRETVSSRLADLQDLATGIRHYAYDIDRRVFGETPTTAAEKDPLPTNGVEDSLARISVTLADARSLLERVLERIG